MGAVRYDMTGQRYGDYVIVSYLDGGDWLARCKCGEYRRMHGSHIRNGDAGRTCLRELTTARLMNLTARETSVAQLVAQGLPNQEVARRLVLSQRTIQTHISNIFIKLGVRNRTELATHLLKNEGDMTDIWQQRAEAMAEIVNAAIEVWESHEFRAIYAGPHHVGERAIVSDEALHRMGKAIEAFKQLAEEEK